MNRHFDPSSSIELNRKFFFSFLFRKPFFLIQLLLPTPLPHQQELVEQFHFGLGNIRNLMIRVMIHEKLGELVKMLVVLVKKLLD